MFCDEGGVHVFKPFSQQSMFPHSQSFIDLDVL